jgi:hypothetical protein
MPERPHSRKVKIEEGVAEVKKGEKVRQQIRASERAPQKDPKADTEAKED